MPQWECDRSHKTLVSALYAVLVACEFCGTSVVAASGDVALVGRLERLQSFVATYNARDDWSLPEKSPLPGVETDTKFNKIILQAEARKVEEFRRLNDRWKHVSVIPPEALEQLPSDYLAAKSRTFIYTGESVEHLQHLTKEPNPMGAIYAKYELPSILLDYGLGIRQVDSPSWMTKEDLLAKESKTRSDDILELTTVTSSGYKHVQCYDPKNGYALVSYSECSPRSNQANYEIRCSDFRNTDGLVLPYLIESWNYSGEEPQRRLVRHRTLTLVKYDLDPTHNRINDYRMDWPEGTTVLDTRINSRFVVHNGQLVPRAIAAITSNTVRNLSAAPSSSMPTTSSEYSGLSSSRLPSSLPVSTPNEAEGPNGRTRALFIGIAAFMVLVVWYFFHVLRR